MARPGKGLLRVWVESIANRQIEQYRSGEHKKEIVDRTAKKMATGYVPHILLLPQVAKLYPTAKDFNDAVFDAISREEVANTGAVEHLSRYYWEIDCSENRWRILEIMTFEPSGELKSSRKIEGDWNHIAADTNTQHLAAMLCPLM